MIDLLKRFAEYYRPHRALFALDFGCALVAGLLELAFPIAVAAFLDQLLPTNNWSLIVLASAGLLAVYALSAGLQATVTYWGHMLGINIETEMRRKAFDHLQKLSFGFFDNHKTGHLVARLTKDLEEIGEVAHHGPEDAFLAVMTLLGAFALMLWVHPTLALITFIVAPATFWVTAVYCARMTATWRALYDRVASFNARIEENVGGIRVVQAFANENHERKLFAQDNSNYRRTKLDAYRVMAMSTSLNYLSARFIQVVVMLAGGYFVIQGDLTPGGFVGFLLLLGAFFRPLDKINAVIETYPKGVAGFTRYTQFLDTRPDIADRPGAAEVSGLRGDIRYRGVSFGYRPERPVFEEFDLDIAAGETVAIVGPSGAGKTTICSVLPRFYEIDKGAITIDGIDIRDMTLQSLRGEIGVVSQETFLFAGTIRQNIAYGRLDATDAEIAAAARRARLDAFIATLPDGLDTVIGERGAKLSGGQKQRVAIARVFLKNPPILILDEATSALDTETERAIQRSLAELCEGRTTLVVAHRLATVAAADRILVVSDGRIVEQGRHDELLERREGHYRRLHSAQAS